jgi:hypothetical protein
LSIGLKKEAEEIGEARVDNPSIESELAANPLRRQARATGVPANRLRGRVEGLEIGADGAGIGVVGAKPGFKDGDGTSETISRSRDVTRFGQ